MKEKQRERDSFPHSRSQLCLHCDDLGLMERPEWGVRIRDPEPNMVWICCMLPDMSIFLVRDLQGHLTKERHSFPCDAEWQLLTGPIGQGDWSVCWLASVHASSFCQLCTRNYICYPFLLFFSLETCSRVRNKNKRTLVDMSYSCSRHRVVTMGNRNIP